ncbi:MAG: ABC transporter ATP-binding protein [Ruminococcaceae bacterium]|nr:ABC transporter ATP-binding protein [Oscillospiraceae bacterium]
MAAPAIGGYITEEAVFEIDLLPDAVRLTLGREGLLTENTALCAFCDREPTQKPGEQYLLCNDQELCAVAGETVTSESGALEWRVLRVDRIPLAHVERWRIEEQRSTGRLILKSEGEEFLLASFTNFCKESVQLFVKYAKLVAKGEAWEIDPKDLPAEKHCPKCGMRYPDPVRKICPRCMERGKLFRRMLGFFARYRMKLLLVLVSLVVLTAASILAPYISGQFFYDEVIFGTGRFYGEILFVLILIIATKLLNTLATMLNNLITSVVSADMVFELKKTIFSAIERLSLSFFTGRQTGGLMTQINEDSNTIYTFFCDSIPYLIINVVKVAVLTVLLFLIQPLLALLALVTVPVFFVVIRLIYRREKKLHAKRFSGSRRMNAFLSDVLSGMRVVKAFSGEQAEIARFSDRNGTLAECDRNLSVYHNFAGTLSGVILYVGNVVSLGVGGYMVMTGYGNLTYGMLMTFLSYMNMIYSPLHFFSDMVNRTADCTNAMQRLFEIMDARPDVEEAESPLSPEEMSGEVEFSNVSFSYVKGKKVIDGVSFKIPDGGCLGIVGHTGAGKSTLANLLMRLYEAEEGEILVGGYPVRELSFRKLYDHVAIVSQETYLFMGTILDNIRYARPDATLEEVIEASKCAGAHDFIMRLPNAYHTRIGFGFQDLSGGERQRLSIARAILKDPKILILDEATAAMDTATERRIQEALSKLVVGKTTIMIAHRLSTLRDADRLIVIEHGRVAEEGTHAELLERENGIYKKLYELQTEALKNAGIVE